MCTIYSTLGLVEIFSSCSDQIHNWYLNKYYRQNKKVYRSTIFTNQMSVFTLF